MNNIIVTVKANEREGRGTKTNEGERKRREKNERERRRTASQLNNFGDQSVNLSELTPH